MTQIRRQDFERRLQNVLNTRLSDESSVHQFETLLNDCANQFARVTSSTDVYFVLQTTPILVQTVTMMLKKCLEKSDMIVQGVHLTIEKRHELLTLNKKLHHHLKEFIKSPKLFNFMSRSSETKLFCHQLLAISNSIGQTDIVVTLYCQKLLVKILTGGSNDEQSQMPSSSVSRLSYMKFDDDDDQDEEFILQFYESIIEQLVLCWHRDETKKIDETRERSYLKIFLVFCQMLQRLLPYPNLTEHINSYRKLIRGFIQIHVALESMFDNENFQLEFFTSSVLLQEIFHHLMKTSSKLFFNDLFKEIASIDHDHYASLVVLCRIIETFDLHQTNSTIDRLISEFFQRIDQCSIQMIQPTSPRLPDSFNKSPIELVNFYEKLYSLLLKLLHHRPTQILLLLMTHLISMENSSIISISNQIVSELILQSSYLYSSNEQCEHLFVLFLGELLRTDRHSIFIEHLLTLPSIQSLKCRIYQNVICSDRLTHVYHLFTSATTEMRKSLNISSIYPNRIDHLLSFVRLFHSDLTSTQQQHAFDTCLYALQQFLSSPFHTESTCEEFRQILRLLTILPSSQSQHEQWKSVLGQLTHLFILLDEQNAIDLRLELLRLFSMHCSLLEENDAGRLLDYILTTSIDSATTHSIGFHLGCLDLLDAFREKSVRSSTINDLIIQLIVRYGNEHQCHPLLKTQLIKTFLGYIHQSHDPSIATRVKSQCALLRANIDELEKNKKSFTSVASKIDPISSRTFNIDRTIPMKFYRRLIEETEGDSSSSEEAMQED